ncbi:nitrilase-related carbon-nitrogen hydrolase [Poriferisphaera sp. WC338]|uniref:nitrilase-related carbon-nitrogen hydrolase n=1 Tax=Poriferisphaera sp. WC338 TaxID=3425129 RepID=UPI003D815E08
MSQTQQVVGVQYDIAWEKPAENVQTAGKILEDFAQEGKLKEGALVVLPEMMGSGFTLKVNRAEEGEARIVETFLIEKAKQYGVWMLGGVVRRGADRKGLNQCVVFDPNGIEVCRYTKIHPFSYGQETDFYAKGKEVYVFKWGGVTVCPLICYDVRFPEIFRHGAAQGAELFTVIANFPKRRVKHWVTLNQARAIENLAYVVAVNRIGLDPFLGYPGRSMVIDARGEIMADAQDETGIISAEIDLDDLAEYRGRFPALKDMRNEFLGLDT